MKRISPENLERWAHEVVNGGALTMAETVELATAYIASRSANRLVLSAIDELQGREQKLQAFKDFVHRRLDEAGVPTHPDGPHSKEGCRIGDRLDLALAPAVAPLTLPEDWTPPQIEQWRSWFAAKLARPERR
ncbi:MAG: hypothetical protein ACREH4_08200 [Vitreimonas sp.]